MSYLNNKNLLSNQQYGFLSGISTHDAVIDLLEFIYNSLDKKQHNINIFIDLSKAFDTVDHKILLTKLNSFGVRGTPHDLLKSYLHNRKQVVRIKNATSTPKTINIGVPQGSILGPLLFLIYINDLPNVSNLLQTILFADDTTLTYSHKNYMELVPIINTELRKIKEWTLLNRLTMNVDKTNLLVCTNKITPNDSYPVMIGTDTINPSHTTKFLGVTLDDRLNFSEHIKLVLSKIAKNTGVLYRIKDNLPLKARLYYYYAFIYPYLTYNIIVWGSTYTTHLSKLVTQQKKIIRIIAGANYLDHTSPLFYQLNLLKIKDIYTYFVAIYMFKKTLNILQEPQHDLNTRYAHHRRPTYHRLTTSQHSIYYMGPTIWNSLPPRIKEIQTISSFKKKLKQHLISSYV